MRSVATHNNVIAYVATSSNGINSEGCIAKLHGFDKIWNKKFSDCFISDIAVGPDGNVYAISVDTSISKITPRGDKVWNKNLSYIDINSSFTLVEVANDGSAFVVDSSNINKGKRIYRVCSDLSETFVDVDEIVLDMAAGDDLYVVVAVENSLYKISSAAVYKRCVFDSASVNSVCLGGNTIFVGTDEGHAYGLDRREHNVKWKYESDIGPVGSVSSTNNFFYVAYENVVHKLNGVGELISVISVDNHEVGITEKFIYCNNEIIRIDDTEIKISNYLNKLDDLLEQVTNPRDKLAIVGCKKQIRSGKINRRYLEAMNKIYRTVV